MFQWVLSFLTAPILNSLVEAYKARLGALNTTEQHAVDLAVADFQADIEARKVAASVQSTTIGGIVDAAFAFPIVVYLNKILIWDMVLGWGSTDPIKDPTVLSWTGLIVGFYFGGRIASSIVSQVVTIFRK